MCRPDDFPPYDRLYHVTYFVETGLRTRSVRVRAEDPDTARAKARALDPQYIATSKTPRIIR